RSRSPVTIDAHRSLKRTEPFHRSKKPRSLKRTEPFHPTNQAHAAQSEQNNSTVKKSPAGWGKWNPSIQF
ncbi:hypothetical protein, partial [Atlantibacter hermannii]|uniref:hypothetical protein n=1 Tax=Atlantibacter hermannii TaxID=565 RepID=UPI0028A94D24